MDSPDLSFYSTAAQVIPVLFLALAFQVRGGFFPSLLDEDWKRLRARREEGRTKKPTDDEMRQALHAAGHQLPVGEAEADALGIVLERAAERAAAKARAVAAAVALVAIIVLVVGEAVALGVLASGEPRNDDKCLVASSLIVGGGLMLFPLVRGQVERLEEFHEFFWRRRYFVTFAVLGAVMFAALLASRVI